MTVFFEDRFPKVRKQGNRLPLRKGRGDRRGSLYIMTEEIFGDFIEMFENCHCERSEAISTFLKRLPRPECFRDSQ
jgi:hypothetical protein